MNYSVIVTIIAILEGVAIFLFYRKKVPGKLLKLKTERDHALKHIDENLKQINKLEAEKKRIKKDAKKIHNTGDVAKFLDSISGN